MITSLSRSLLHIFYPHLCAGCGNNSLHEDQLLCTRCTNDLPLTGFHYFPDNPVENIFRGRIPVTSATAWLYFTKDSSTQRLIHLLKYKNRQEIGIHFGRKLGKALITCGRFDDIDLLVPLPLFAARERKRGYNQAAVICKGISDSMGLPVNTRIISRSLQGGTQTQRTRIERWQNITGGFVLNDPSSIEGKHVLLVDDVITTGATLEACGQELLKAEKTRLSIVALAYTSR